MSKIAKPMKAEALDWKEKRVQIVIFVYTMLRLTVFSLWHFKCLVPAAKCERPWVIFFVWRLAFVV